MNIRILGGKGFKKNLFGKVTQDEHFVTILITGFCNVEENELFYPVQEFNQKGLKKVLSENGYRFSKGW